jgi:hypothetical protein
MLTKRSFITAATAIAFTATLGLSPALAIGGNDPIPGIDIIVKEDPGSRPIKPFSLTEREMKQLNSLKDADRPTFTLKLIAEHIGADGKFVEAGLKAYSEQGCPPKPWTYCGDPEVFSVGEVTYTLDLNFHGDDIGRPTKIIPTKPVDGSPRLKQLPVK